jgi:hypothetical protein
LAAKKAYCTAVNARTCNIKTFVLSTAARMMRWWLLLWLFAARDLLAATCCPIISPKKVFRKVVLLS